MNHTPIPWSYGIGNRSREIYDANGALIAETYENVQDRFYIVHCVNMHEELVEALKDFVAYFIGIGLEDDEDGEPTPEMIKARAVLAKEKEE